MRNRDEQLVVDSSGSYAGCDWLWTSDLHIAKVFPFVGRALMKRAFNDHPIAFRDEPARRQETPDVSFIIGHRGLERVPHLMATLSTIAAQVDVAFECVVVEQSNEPEVETLLPSWVRYVHTPLPYKDMPYSRSWTFNVGAEMALGSLLIFQDNDMLVPQRYAAEIAARYKAGYEVINIKRFIFYLDRKHSERILSSRVMALDAPPEVVVQNLEAGGSFGIARDAFFDIGGFDEAFVGWGGEDIEFWERAQTRRVWPYTYLPMVHLWHEAQPGKRAVNGNGLYTAELTEQKAAIPTETRINELRSRQFESGRKIPPIES
jgi:hypothetical protein